MAQVLVVGAVMTCSHAPIHVTGSTVLKVAGQPVLVESDFTTAVFDCAAPSPGPCKKLGPITAGLSTVLRVGGKAVVLSSAVAVTLGSGTSGKLTVTDPGQTILDAK
ncbi:hypothetical protein [Nocardia pseudobrasiliensis]|uniref:Uncharacterized protein n=1 Tax=Nocardia pseudobrasiliensis TaxID=45979 RepID=A0A370IFC3_9NOCA|nr:hypothetical protein [Nocardia pseudobrasiliensis]RDI68164.1 hypothetical protein DFR76_102565 [Nocardia pseudobrasiliensis]